MDWRVVPVALLALVPGCAGFYHHDKSPEEVRSEDPTVLDSQISSMNSQLNTLDSQIVSLNQQITAYRNAPGQGSQALQAQQQRDRLQMQRNALSSQQSSLQIIRNSQSVPMPKPAPLTKPWIPPPTAPIH
jgi:uncharacterized protein YlxW (UPF0749 family)